MKKKKRKIAKKKTSQPPEEPLSPWQKHFLEYLELEAARWEEYRSWWPEMLREYKERL